MNKKACQTLKKKLFLIGLGCLSFFIFGCGLDVYYVLPDPITAIETPSYDKNSQSDQSFTFFTNEDIDSSLPADFFLGTDVYYKIYSNSSKMITETESLRSLASSSSDTSNAAANKLVTTYNYKKLGGLNYNNTPLIPYYVHRSDYSKLTDLIDSKEKTYHRVNVKLTNYYDLYPATINIQLVNNGKTIDTFELTPIRGISGEKTFDFGRDGNNNAVPKSDDEDVNYTSMSDGNKWYVAMFAVAVGRDTLYTMYYSNILYLGSVTIDADSENN